MNFKKINDFKINLLVHKNINNKFIKNINIILYQY